jgi:hypothetical protein
MKNTSIVLIAVIAAVMVGAFTATMTGPAFAATNSNHFGQNANGVNGGSGGPGNSDFGHSQQGASGQALEIKHI